MPEFKLAGLTLGWGVGAPILRPTWSWGRLVTAFEIPVELGAVVTKAHVQEVVVDVEHFQYRRVESRVESIGVSV